MVFFIFIYCVCTLTTAVAAPRNEIRLNIPNLTLRYYENGKLLRVYPVAAGRSSSRTPLGNYSVTNKAKNPTWFPPNSRPPVPPGPRNPLGRRWIGFKPSYGIHGNNNPNSIGSFVSMGCVRLYNFHVEELYDKINIGLPVKVTYETIRVGRKSKPYIVVYPDIYGLNKNSKCRIQKKLNENGISISQEKFSNLMNKVNNKPVIFASGYVVTLNGEVITSDVVKNQNGFYVNKSDIENSLNTHIDSSKPLFQEKYIHIDEVFNIDGLSKKINSQEERIDISGFITTINGKIISGTRQGNQGNVYVPIREISNKLGFQLTWNQKASIPCLNGMPVNSTVISGRSYLNYTDLEKKLNCKLFFDGKKGIINICKLIACVNNKKIDGAKLIAGKVCLPVRKVADVLGYNVNWEKNKVVSNNVELSGITIGQTFYSNVEKIAEAYDLKLEKKPGHVQLVGDLQFPPKNLEPNDKVQSNEDMEDIMQEELKNQKNEE